MMIMNGWQPMMMTMTTKWIKHVDGSSYITKQQQQKIHIFNHIIIIKSIIWKKKSLSSSHFFTGKFFFLQRLQTEKTTTGYSIKIFDHHLNIHPSIFWINVENNFCWISSSHHLIEIFLFFLPIFFNWSGFFFFPIQFFVWNNKKKISVDDVIVVILSIILDR